MSLNLLFLLLQSNVGSLSSTHRSKAVWQAHEGSNRSMPIQLCVITAPSIPLFLGLALCSGQIHEQSSFLKSHIVPIAVTTPGRLVQLMDQGGQHPSGCLRAMLHLPSSHPGSLMCGELKMVVIDWYWRDAKLRRFSEVPEVWQQGFVGLYHTHLHPLIRTRQSKIALF